MLATLIEEGKTLESAAKETTMGTKFFDSVDFETWAAKSISYLEQQQRGFTVTERMLEKYKNVNQNNNYDFYNQLLGALQSFA
ncbi:MAG: hypothetical protein ABS942_15655 [Solibacillus sp.]